MKAEMIQEGGILKIFTISGDLVREIIPKNGRAEWDGRNQRDRMVASGTYYYLIQRGKEVLKTGKLVVIRD